MPPRDKFAFLTISKITLKMARLLLFFLFFIDGYFVVFYNFQQLIDHLLHKFFWG
jgi:hypothetical protein